jgi:hypothetical protein
MKIRVLINIIEGLKGHLRGIFAQKFLFILECPTIFYLLFCLPRKIDEKCTFRNFLRGIFLLFLCPGKSKKKTRFC